MWSTKLSEDAGENEEPDATGEIIICDGTMGTHEQLAQAVLGSLERLEPDMIHSIPESEYIQDKYCIFLDCGKTSFLSNVTTEEDFAKLKAIVLDTRGLLWVTADDDDPEFARIGGLLRTLRLEDSTKKLLWLNKVPSRDPEQATDLISNLTESLVKDPSSSSSINESLFHWQTFT